MRFDLPPAGTPRRPCRRTAVLLLPLVWLVQLSRAAVASPAEGAPGRVHMQARHVDFHLLGDIVISADLMDGEMRATPGKTISLDDRSSFTLVVRGATTRLSAQNLSALLNQYVLPRAESPTEHVELTFEGQTVRIKGTVRKLLPVPFEARATLSPTAAGDLRVHVIEFRAAGVVTKGFLDLLGIKLDQLAEPRRRSSFRIEGDDLIVPVHVLFPPPLIFARLTAARIEGDSLVEVLGHAHPLAVPPQPARNYILFLGGRMHFGKVTMDDVDLELIDNHPADNLDFSLDRYLDQIAAGYARMRPNLGVTAYIEDYRALPSRP